MRASHLSILALALIATGSACQSNTTFAVERRRQARVPLAAAHRLAVVAFVGSGGEAVAAAIRARLSKEGAFSVDEGEPAGAAALRGGGAEGDDDSALARAARAAGIDALIVGQVAAFEIRPETRTATMVTKSLIEGPTDVPTVRRIKTARLAATFHAVLASGRVERGRAIEKDLRAERLEDPMPKWLTLEPKNPESDPIPSDAEVAERLAEALAADVARDATPRRDPAIVVWEDAGGEDDDARRLFAKREYVQAAKALAALLERSTSERAQPHSYAPVERAALLYDLGLCEDVVGETSLAERHLDEALTLSNTELHQSALRDLRRRDEDRRREEKQ